MGYLATAYSDPNIDIYTSANKICDHTVDADNFQMVVCTVTLSSLHTDESTISISTYVDGKLLNGYAAKRIKASGATSVYYQLDPIFINANDKLRIDVQSSNANDTNINATGMIYKTQQANVRLWNDADVADLTDLATSAEITALESHGDTTWATATGFSTHSAADVKSAMEAAGSMLSHLHATTEADGESRKFTEAALADAPGSDVTAEEIAQAVLGLDVADVETTAPEHSLTTLVLACLESSISETTWTIKQTDGETTHVEKTVSTSENADPITGVQ